MSNRHICIHGHFYQPPREHAWLEVVERQDSAYPFHDWNDKINFECYAPNSAARILDEKERIKNIFNNYTKISFNFGPTLLHWLERQDPLAYETILDADKRSRELYDGHGSAIAQVYSHLIMPLANDQDKLTQVIWGIRDFEARFNRAPEGMWLSETAVCLETLEILAAHDIKFTILAPRQAKAVKKIGDPNWNLVHSGNLETRKPYQIELPSKRTIAVFFYDGQIAKDVAFNGLLNNGKDFANRLHSGFDGQNDQHQIVQIATDGESYGHHHKRGEMALAACIEHIEENGWAKITNYGQYLEKYPPEFEAQIHEFSSWSCVHGVERWRSDCGCHTGGRPDWNQSWRGPLRDALDWLRDKTIHVFEQEGKKYLKDHWAARNDYISVILNRDQEEINRFFKTHSIKKLGRTSRTHVLRMMELQRNALLMYTSCGWFFDEISGIETNQILQYACRVIYYAKQVGNIDIEQGFIDKLALAPSNIPEYKNGAVSYKTHVLPGRIDLSSVGMHYAISSLFEEVPQQLHLFNYIATSEFFERYNAGNYRIAFGRTTVESKITLSKKRFSFVVLYLGQQNMIGYISRDMKRPTFDKMFEDVMKEWDRSHLGEVISLMQKFFGEQRFTIHSLFHDEKRKVLDLIMEKSMEKVEEGYREIYFNNYQLMNASLESGIGIPEAFKTTLKFLLRKDLNQFFEEEKLHISSLHELIREFKKWDVPVGHKRSFLLTASERLYREINELKGSVEDMERINLLNAIFADLNALGVELEVWKCQNGYFNLMKKVEKDRADMPLDLIEEYALLGKNLNFRTEISDPN